MISQGIRAVSFCGPRGSGARNRAVLAFAIGGVLVSLVLLLRWFRRAGHV
jgi:hypothetical protein